MERMRQALFFLRHYNDIDHIVPVIYKWSRSGHCCTVILIGFSDVRADYRIRYISKLARVKVFDFRELVTGIDQLKFRFLSLVLYSHACRYLNDAFFRFFEIFWPAEKREQFWGKIAVLLLDKAFPENFKGAVAFDWISHKSTLPIEFVRRVLVHCRTKGHIGVSLPHGDSPHFNELIRNQELRIEPQIKYASSDIFDYIVCPNELCAKRYRPFIDANKIKVLGSPRYSDEWLQIMSNLLPESSSTASIRKSEQELYVVFFLRKKEFSLFWDEIKRVIVMILQFENVRLIVKPHTRDYLQEPLSSLLKQIKSPRLEIAKDDTHSASLLAQADVIIDIATSVTFEAIKRGIPVLAADYLHAGYSAIAHYIPEAEMRCRDDIYHAIAHFIEDPHREFYDKQHRITFIREMLDVPDKYVLERYVSLLAGDTCIKNNPLA
jgi:hypothetical protein